MTVPLQVSELASSTAGANRAWRPDNPEVRRHAAWLFCAVGVGSVVLGGLVAALTRPFELDSGPWVAAYLVLVSGVAQVGLGAGQAGLATRPPGFRVVLVELLAWNTSTVAIILGTLLGWPLLTSAGALCLLLAVGLLVQGVPVRSANRSWPAAAHLALASLVALSAPVGVMLAWIRHG